MAPLRRATYLLAYVLCLALARCNTSALDELHASQLAVWQASTGCSQAHAVEGGELDWQLLGEGAHRQLQYRLGLTAVKAAPACSTLQEVHLAVPLPNELFFDPYQLQGLAKSQGGWFNITVFGSTDLESPASHSTATTLGVRVDVPAWERQHAQAVQLGHWRDMLNITLPIHSRYPVANYDTGANSSQAWWAPYATGMVTVNIGTPHVLVKCAHSGPSTENQYCYAIGQAAGLKPQDTVTWRIPAGSLQHADIAAIGTMVSAVLACAVILAVLFRDRLAQPQSVGVEKHHTD